MAQSDVSKFLTDETVDPVTARSYLRTLTDALKTGELSLKDDDTFLSLTPGTRVRFRLRAKSDPSMKAVSWDEVAASRRKEDAPEGDE